MVGRPAPHPNARGFLGAWVSAAMMWSSTTRRLLTVDQPGDQMLAMVAMYLCMKSACLLIDGGRDVPLDGAARADCPVPIKQLHHMRDRLQLFRDEVLHFTDTSDSNRGISLRWSADPPHYVYESSVGRTNPVRAEITKSEIEGMLAKLEPWLYRHWKRLAKETEPMTPRLSWSRLPR